VEHWQDWQSNGAPKHLGDLWTLRKGARRADCVLVGHPRGCEVRVEVDGKLVRSEAFSGGAEAVVEATAWRDAFTQKGWRGDGA